MKKIIIYSSLLIMSIWIASCGEQSLGPNADIKYIDNTVDTVDIPEETRVEIESVDFSMYEFLGRSRLKKEWKFKTVTRVIYVDTSGVHAKIFMNLKFECAEQENELRMRKDWLDQFTIRFTALLDQKLFLLNEGSTSGRWSNFRFNKRANVLKALYFQGVTMKNAPIISLEEFRDEGFIKGTIKVYFNDAPLQSNEFLVEFRLNFK